MLGPEVLIRPSLGGRKTVQGAIVCSLVSPRSELPAEWSGANLGILYSDLGTLILRGDIWKSLHTPGSLPAFPSGPTS